MKDQADKTGDIARQAVVQASAARSLADAAKIQSDNTVTLAKAATDQVAKLEALNADTVAQNRILSGQLDTMKSQLETTQRAWITVTDGSANHLIAQAGAEINTISLSVALKTKNIGNLPATKVWVDWRLFAPSLRDLGDIKSRQRKVCADDIRSGGESFLDLVPNRQIIPSDIKNFQASVNGPVEGINQFGKIIVVLVGCVNYTFISSSLLHQTGFIFVVNEGPERLDGTIPDVLYGDLPRLIIGGKPIPEQVLTLTDWTAGDATLN